MTTGFETRPPAAPQPAERDATSAAIAALASLLLPSRAQVQAHLEEARRLAEADVDVDAAVDASRPAPVP